ncbi:hypothetical protein B0H14DRAFT_2655103 [Mycena olivaceomarginata]|nr:hypothetical protein B0H14DRAFT_2655103 [Mycena olivaceomarginata]
MEDYKHASDCTAHRKIKPVYFSSKLIANRSGSRSNVAATWLRMDTGRGYTRGFVPAALHPSSKLEYFRINKDSKTANSTVDEGLHPVQPPSRAHSREKTRISNEFGDPRVTRTGLDPTRTRVRFLRVRVRVGPKVPADVPVSILKLGPKRAATRLIAEHVTVILPPVTALYAAWYL